MKIIKKYKDWNMSFATLCLLGAFFALDIKAMYMSPQGRARAQRQWKKQKPKELESIITEDDLAAFEKEMQQAPVKEQQSAKETIQQKVAREFEEVDKYEKQQTEQQQKELQEDQQFKEQLKQQKLQTQQRRKDFLDSMQKNSDFQKFQQQLRQDEIAKGWFGGPSKQWKNQIISLAVALLEPYNKNRFKSEYGFGELRSYISSAICSAIDTYDETCYFRLYDVKMLCDQISTNIDKLLLGKASQG